MELCNEFMCKNLLNCEAYTCLELGLVITGTLLWNVLYIIIIINSFRLKWVEMPLVVATANLAWEFTWGFLFETELGILFQWGLRVWFFLDLLIYYHVVVYGYKQLKHPTLVKFAKPLILLGTISWGMVIYFFVQGGYDTPMGGTSAYIIMVMISAYYLLLFLQMERKELFSYANSWLKLIGTLFMSAFIWLHYPNLYFLLCLTVVGFILDILYVGIFMRYRNQAKTS